MQCSMVSGGADCFCCCDVSVEAEDEAEEESEDLVFFEEAEEACVLPSLASSFMHTLG
jgi:hypothetical protein